MSDPRVTIKIPRTLYHRIRELIADGGFSSPTEFIVHVLRDLVAESGDSRSDGLSREELRAVRTRLRNLGYLRDPAPRPEDER